VDFIEDLTQHQFFYVHAHLLIYAFTSLIDVSQNANCWLWGYTDFLLKPSS
jgi:hypothetical protein